MKSKEIHILDDLWSMAVKFKVKFQCEHCKIRGIRMEAAHVVGRRHRATRWGSFIGGLETYDLCGHCLCHNCHQQYDEHGPREHAIVEVTIGVLRKALIQHQANTLVAKTQDFDVIKGILEGLINGYGDERISS